MAPDQGHADRSEASLFNRRQYLVATGALAGIASTGSAAAQSEGATVDARVVSTNHDWTTVTVDAPISAPVVVAPTLSFDGTNPASPRVRNVTDAGFEMAVEEWAYLDGRHLGERIGCFVTDPGAYGTANGRQFVVGTVRSTHRWTSAAFSRQFDSTPIVLSNAVTVNGRQPVVTRQRNVTASGFDVRLQEEEAEGPHLEERIGYLAVEEGADTIDGRSYEARGGIGVGSNWQTITFDGSYQRPVFLADMQTTRGTNTTTVRYRNLSESSVEVTVEEEQSEDSETNHLKERVGYLVIEGESQTDPATGYGTDGYGDGGFGA